MNKEYLVDLIIAIGIILSSIINVVVLIVNWYSYLPTVAVVILLGCSIGLFGWLAVRLLVRYYTNGNNK